MSTETVDGMYQGVEALVRNKKAIVCCGAGGVGKTSVAAALAMAGARAGRRVLVVTIDPSRRLAESLGVARNPPEPVPVDAERLAAAGVQAQGTLDAWMLDPRVVTEVVIRSEAEDPNEISALLSNRVYRHVSSMVAGLQEYAAVEALFMFLSQGRYDLVILDTPPSRNALQFLDAPKRATLFLDGRVFKLFIPGEGNLIRRATAHLIGRVMDATLGEAQRIELQEFFKQFSEILARTRRHAGEMKEFFAQPDVAFLIVTSPAQEALTEAYYFEKRTRKKLGVNVQGFILNRSLAAAGSRKLPSETFSQQPLPPAARSALEKLEVLASAEVVQAEKDLQLHHELARRIGSSGLAVALPYLSMGVSDLDSLALLMEALLAAPPRPQLEASV